MKILMVLSFLTSMIYPVSSQEIFQSHFELTRFKPLQGSGYCRPSVNKPVTPFTIDIEESERKKIESVNFDAVIANPIFSFFDLKCLLESSLLRSDDLRDISMENQIDAFTVFADRINLPMPKEHDLLSGPFSLKNMSETDNPFITFDKESDVYIYEEKEQRYLQVYQLDKHALFYLPIGKETDMSFTYTPNFYVDFNKSNQAIIRENKEASEKSLTVSVGNTIGNDESVDAVIDEITNENTEEVPITETTTIQEELPNEIVPQTLNISLVEGFYDVAIQLYHGEKLVYTGTISNAIDIEVVPGQYKLIATQTNSKFQQEIIEEIEINENGQHAIVLSFPKIIGEIIVTVSDDNTKAIELYQLLNGKRTFIDAREVKNIGEIVTFSNLEAGEFIIKKIEKKITGNREELTTSLSIQQPQQQVSLEVGKEQIKLLANTGEYTGEKIVISALNLCISFLITTTIRSRKKLA